MEDWQKPLTDDPLPWLLEPENPSVQYWTLTDLLGLPPDSAEVQAARAAIREQPLVRELFRLQHPDGHWGEDPARPYTAEGVVAVLALLHLLGVPPDERTAAGCASFLTYSQNESGGFSMVKTQRSGIFPCTTGQHLPFLVYFGQGDDPRVRQSFAFLIAAMDAEDVLVCGRYAHQACLWGAIAALNGLAVLPANLRTERSQRVVARLADALLSANYDFSGEHKRWLTFGVPRAWDLLSACKALALHGCAGDPRFAALFGRVLSCQNGRGQWLCGSTARTWPLEKRNAPSKWVTLDALRVLQRIPRG